MAQNFSMRSISLNIGNHLKALSMILASRDSSFSFMSSSCLCISLRLGVGDFVTGAFADVAADVDDEDFVGHVDLAFVHIVKHGFGAFSPDFVVSAVSEQTDGYDDVAFKGQTFLCFQVLLFELRAAAEGYYFVFADHGLLFNVYW